MNPSKPPHDGCEHFGVEHENHKCQCNTSRVERATELRIHSKRVAEALGVDHTELRLMPTVDGGKMPAINHMGGDDDNDLIESPLESQIADEMLVTPGEAAERLISGENEGFAMYFGKPAHGTEGVLAVDRDDPDTFPDDEMPETGLVVVSGSGTDPGHYYYTSDTMERGSADAVLGEVRVQNQYCLVPGSLHPSGGIYHLSSGGRPADIGWDDIPEPLQPTATGERRDMDDVRLEPKDSGTSARYENEMGMSLEEVREHTDKLDRLLTRLNPGGYQSRSEADFATASILHFWRFSTQDITNTLQQYRRYEKTERPGYVKHTVSKAATGEQIDLDADEPEEYEPMPSMPLARLDRLSHEERVRYAKRRGIDWPDIDSVRERLYDTITAAVEDGDTVVISSPTGSGKTHAVATRPWLAEPELTGEQPVIHSHGTREARDEAADMSDEYDVDSFTLKGRKELCECAAGHHDPGNIHGDYDITIDGEPLSEWIDHRCDRQGIPFSVVHGWMASELEGKPPCERGNTECPAKGQFNDVPRTDEGTVKYDVVHCTHQFLTVPSMRMHTNVFIDEKPSFGIDITPEAVRESINAYLSYVDAPVSNYRELVRASETGRPPGVTPSESVGGLVHREVKESFAEEMEEVLSGTNAYVECDECKGTGLLDEDGIDSADITAYPEETDKAGVNECPACHGRDEVLERRGRPPLSWFKDNPDAHAMAPAFARAVWEAEESAARTKAARVPYEPPRFDSEARDTEGWNRVYVDVVLDSEWRVRAVESCPDFTLSDAVVGLDAHPQPSDPVWLANVDPDMTTDHILSTEERTLYRRYERGLYTVQVGEGVQPVTTGEWLDGTQGQKFRAVVQQLRDEYGEDFDSAITSMEARRHIVRAMEGAGVEEPETMYYGNEESRNDFAGKEVGLVAGSIDPGDDRVVNLCARLGLDVDIPHNECPDCEGTGNVHPEDGEPDMCETCHGEGEVRERGRTFEGEDADAAQSVLRGVRENHVAQSAGRWARNAEDPDDTATVFIITEATPAGFIDAKVPGVTWTTNEGQRERLRYVRDSPEGATASEVAETTGCSKRTALRTLKRADEEGLLEKTPGAGPYGADVFSPDDDFTPEGAVDVGAGEPRQDAYEVTNTYTVAVDAALHCATDQLDRERDDWLHQSTFEWFEPPDIPI